MTHKRITAIHDISCFGRCSLTVALPILSAAGIETTVIPTAILSTHTGGFSNYTFLDLTDNILPIAKHWNEEKITSSAVYTGYLGSKKQINIVIEAINLLKNDNTLIIVDPAMADNGALYGGFPEDFPLEMLKLSKKADILIPNITEACMLLGKEYIEGPYDKDFIEQLLTELYNLTGAKVILTGVWLDHKRIGAACYDNGTIDYVFSERIEASYHGTGDVFASVLVASVMNGKTLKEAAQIAADFTFNAIKHTMILQPNKNYGVCFENELPKLIKMLELDR